MESRGWPTIVQATTLLFVVLLALPFVLHAVNFGQSGLRRTLPSPHYLFSTNTTANIVVFGHMITGALITLLVPFQLIQPLRVRAPKLHRWSGRIILCAALPTSLGGLIYITQRGTIGGAPMDAGFILYGLLVFLAAAQTFRFARARRITQHHAWALRFFWLALGSWLYRVHYTVWYLTTDGLWSTPQFSGGFDLFQNFGFYLPYSICVEIYLYRKRYRVAVS